MLGFGGLGFRAQGLGLRALWGCRYAGEEHPETETQWTIRKRFCGMLYDKDKDDAKQDYY